MFHFYDYYHAQMVFMFTSYVIDKMSNITPITLAILVIIIIITFFYDK